MLAVSARLTVEEYDLAGTLLDREERKNLTMLFGKKLLLATLFDQSPSDPLIGVAVGGNNTAPANTDATLYQELIRLPLVSVSSITNNGSAGLVTVRAIMASTVGNGNIYREAGLVSSLSAGVPGLYNRVTFADKTKSASKAILFQFDFTLS